MEDIVDKTVSTLLQRTDKKKHSELKEACESVLQIIKARDGQGAALGKFDRNFEKLFPPYAHALESKNPRLVEVAVDGIEKLFSFGYLHGDLPSPSHPERRVAEEVVEAICAANDSDEQVQVQIIKALLTAVNSRHSAIHDHVLALSLKTCFHICLATKNHNIQVTAKATLTQMVTALSKRVEAAGSLPPHSLPSLPTATATTASATAATSDGVAPVPVSPSSTTVTATTATATVSHSRDAVRRNTVRPPLPGAVSPAMVTELYCRSIVDKVVMAATTSGADCGESGGVAGAGNDANGADVGSHNRVAVPNLSDGGIVGWCHVCGMPADEVHATVVVPVCSQESCWVACSQRDCFDPKVAAESQSLREQGFANVHERDAHVVFLRICKLTMKSMDSTDETIAMRSKMLSLELILAMLQSAGTHFTSHEKFIVAVKQHLCLSLLQNGISPSASVSHLSLRIFMQVLAGFKVHMKDEIGLILSNVFIRLLENQESSFQQKMAILQLLHKICQDPQTIVDVYVNYDCSLAHQDIFERLVNILAKLVQGQSLPNLTPEQGSQLRTRGVEALVTIVVSLVEWSQTKGTDELSAPARNAAAMYAAADAIEAASVASPVAASSGVGSVGRATPSNPTSPSNNNDDNGGSYLGAGEETEGSRVEGSNSTATATATPSAGAASGATGAGMSAAGADSPTASGDGGHGGDGGDGGPSATATPAGSAAASNVVDGQGSWTDSDARKFSESKARKIASRKDEALALSLFNDPDGKPDRGVKHMISQGYFEDSPDGIAQFLHVTKGLDKVIVGEYLGNHKEEYVRVMHAYVDQMSFLHTSIDLALRKFVAGFMLPGEAQKIDRLMEKFAERYHKDNPESFTNADTAYVLAYSIIMLNTDAHNDKVKNKMTKEGFLRNNRGIDDGADLPNELLEAIYDRIVASPFRLSDAPNQPGPAAADPSVPVAKPSHRQEAEAILRHAAAFLRDQQRGGEQAVFYRASHAEHVQAMFQVAWCPMLAAFSVVLEHSQDPTLVTLCLDGMKYSIRVLSVFLMQTERDAFVSTLAHFTNLHAVREIREKNIEAIKTCIFIAHTNGNYLQASWGPVLRCISMLDRLHLIGSGGQDEQVFFQDPSAGARGGQQQKGLTDGVAELNSQSVADQIDAVAIDWIFSNSANLSDEAIVDFVTQLVAIGREEIESSTHPRVFALQKIVEISYFNMSRIRIVWSRIWQVIGGHFFRVATHPNRQIAMYAVDSLRQLAMKFLEKAELANFAFQRDFLRPFNTVYSAPSATPEIRELILRCLTQLALSRAHIIRSGWKSILHALTLAARDKSEGIMQFGFELAMRIATDFLHLVGDSYADCINTLVAFGGNTIDANTAVQAVALIRDCTARLTSGSVPLANGEIGGSPQQRKSIGTEPAPSGLAPLPLTPAAVVSGAGAGAGAGAHDGGPREFHASPQRPMTALAFSDSDIDFRVWFPTLTGLSRLISDSRKIVRQGALQCMFGILNDNGRMFSIELWELIFSGVLFPLFDDIRFADESAIDVEWLTSTGEGALRAFVKLVVDFESSVGFVIPQVLALLRDCIQQHDPRVSSIGVASLGDLICGTSASDDGVAPAVATTATDDGAGAGGGGGGADANGGDEVAQEQGQPLAAQRSAATWSKIIGCVVGLFDSTSLSRALDDLLEQSGKAPQHDGSSSARWAAFGVPLTLSKETVAPLMQLSRTRVLLLQTLSTQSRCVALINAALIEALLSSLDLVSKTAATVAAAIAPPSSRPNAETTTVSTSGLQASTSHMNAMLQHVRREEGLAVECTLTVLFGCARPEDGVDAVGDGDGDGDGDGGDASAFSSVLTTRCAEFLHEYNEAAAAVMEAQNIARAPAAGSSAQSTPSGAAGASGRAPMTPLSKGKPSSANGAVASTPTGRTGATLLAAPEVEELARVTPFVLLILDQLIASDDAAFMNRVRGLYEPLCGLIECGNAEVRQRVARVFVHRLGPIVLHGDVGLRVSM